MSDITVLVIDGGARGHAISKAYERSKKVGRIIVAPGNDFIAFNRKKEVIVEKNCNLKDMESILAVAEKYEPELSDVAQDDALAGGAVDLLTENGFLTFGPSKKAARIEWDKGWSRNFMKKYRIPAPNFRTFTSEEVAKNCVGKIYERNPEKIIYVKAAGLCGGKGAEEARSYEEAILKIEQMKSFGSAGEKFLIEDGLVGEEFSEFAISDGGFFRRLGSAQDNKKAERKDKGKQTGGMGGNSPAMVAEENSKEIEELLISRPINGMKSEGIPFKGILYAGGISVEENGRRKIYDIEFNARLGDPEASSLLPSIKNYADMVLASMEGGLDKIKAKRDNKTRVCVVGASEGYPADYSKVKGKRIYGIEEAMKLKGVKIFGAGTEVRDEKFFANGGRLLDVVGEGNNIIEARRKAYSAISLISVEENSLHYRPDIGWRDVERFWKYGFAKNQL